MRLLISDSGNLGRATAKQCEEEGVFFGFFEDKRTAPETDIAVYVGRGRRFDQFLDFCTEKGISVLQCSSDVDMATRPQPRTPVFDVPNAAESVMLFLEQMERLAKSLKRRGIEVDWMLTESHQASKKSPPRTALRLAEILGIPREKIHSLRRRSEFHSYHGLLGYVKDSDEGFEYACRVEGMGPYAKGILKLAAGLHRENQEIVIRKGGLYKTSDIRHR